MTPPGGFRGGLSQLLDRMNEPLIHHLSYLPFRGSTNDGTRRDPTRRSTEKLCSRGRRRASCPCWTPPRRRTSGWLPRIRRATRTSGYAARYRLREHERGHDTYMPTSLTHPVMYEFRARRGSAQRKKSPFLGVFSSLDSSPTRPEFFWCWRAQRPLHGAMWACRLALASPLCIYACGHDGSPTAKPACGTTLGTILNPPATNKGSAK